VSAIWEDEARISAKRVHSPGLSKIERLMLGLGSSRDSGFDQLFASALAKHM
jgi:hypothetical protein